MRIAVCDDEKAIQTQLKELIQKRLFDAQITVYDSGRQFLADVLEFDLLFLDIQMEGLNGIETAKELRKITKETVLIFITGSKDYVFEAFDVAAFHYLLKPISEEKFVQVLARAVAEAERRTIKSAKKLFIKTKQRNLSIPIEDILYIESQLRKVEIHLLKETIVAYASLKELESQLSPLFYRCHRGYLVNMAYIAEYKKDCIVLANQQQIYLSKEKYGEFVKAYLRYLKKGGETCWAKK